MSTEPFTRVLWVVLDGFGYEHARRALESGTCPALARIAREGCLGLARPAQPVCQTPPALLALFAGSQPAENGVWGYYMPDPRQIERSMSGFHADVSRVRTLWQEAEERGIGYSLMNVAFRNDPVWRGPAQSMVLGFDGYRLWSKPSLHRLRNGMQRISYRGIELRAFSSRKSVVLRKGSRNALQLHPGEGRLAAFTAGTKTYAHLVAPGVLVLNPLNEVICRRAAGSPAHPLPGSDGFLEMSAFHLARRENAARPPEALIPLASEMLPEEASFTRKADLMLAQAADLSARLVVAYFPLIDDFNHAYMDLFESEWPQGRASDLFRSCARLVDDLLAALMNQMGDDTLLVVSSDHGAAAHRSMLHVNELFAEAGLVRRGPGGYDFRRSSLWYHPSDCGQVVARDPGQRKASLASVRRVIDAANSRLGARIGVREPLPGEPFAAFLFPQGDVYFSGRPPRRAGALARGKAGGHHLSPLSPTPWIQALLGAWSPRPGSAAALRAAAPSDNTAVKRFIRDAMEL